MRAFIDSSSLLKKYIIEAGSDEFLRLLDDVTEIIVAPICWLEIQSALARRLRERTLTKDQGDWVCKEVKIDFNYFQIVKWNENLEEKGTEYLYTYHLKTLDSIQLSAGYLAAADVFITSDRQLFSCAKKELKAIRFIA